MYHRYQEKGEKRRLAMNTTQIQTESHGHTLRFRYKYKKYVVDCNESMAIQQGLQTNIYFNAICKKTWKGGNKDVIILREQMPRAAVAPHFPCSLLNHDELLDISFIRSGGNSGTWKTQKLAVHSPGNLVCFYIKARGEKKIRTVLKNNELRRIVDYVCVYALKGEMVKEALKRDGRFNKVIFRKGALYGQETENTVSLSNLVDHLNGEQFQIIVSPHQTGSQESSQESSQEISQEFMRVYESESADAKIPQKTNPNQVSTSTKQKETVTRLKENKSRKYPETKEIPNTQEIVNLLQEQHRDLLKTLKEQENLKNNGEVKRFFRVEFDKSVQSFSEVNMVKQLMMLSDSVCQIRVDGSPIGTGFLLFKRFVLTNAHVVRDLFPCIPGLQRNLTAVFGFEALNFAGNVIPVEPNLVSFFEGKDYMGNYLDFALLELSSDVELGLPELLRCYSTPPTRGGVCVIGHPGGGVKRMDPCFIIANEDIPQAVERHLEKTPNLHVFRVITKRCLADDWAIHKSQITYNSCFFHGSSGSPVFDEHCNLIGIHTGGYVYEGERRETRSVMEYGLPMLPVLVRIFIQCSERRRSDIVQHFECQKNLTYVLQVANKQLQENIRQPNDIRLEPFFSATESKVSALYRGIKQEENEHCDVVQY
ncbi:serine protease FAM111A-like [Clarias gariepinus]|uniref:serine protease FAM111A-like n=1 Tax=Clarias gariepinus TaxID=13013 RepID=UPI00234D0118|nr:serine protease FAM111A-like [Clarias gariepinus]